MAQGAFAQDMNMEEGKWELTVTGNVFGTPMNETSMECTTPEDMDISVADFLNKFSAELGCSTGNLWSTNKIHEGEIVCPVDSPFKDGKFILMTSPRTFAMYSSFNTNVPMENYFSKMAVLSHKVGPC